MATTVKSLQKENNQLKTQIEALANDFKRLEQILNSKEEKATDEQGGHNSTQSSPDADTVRSLEFLGQEYDDLNTFRSAARKDLSALNTRLSELTTKVEEISNAVDELQQYSYGYNIKLLGIPELGPNETAKDTTALCTKIFNEMGAEISIHDIDIAHRVLSRNSSGQPKPIICKFVRRIAREQVMTKRQEACKVNPKNLGLLESFVLTEARLLDHLTPKIQQLLSEAKQFRDVHHFSYCWTKNAVVYLRKSENSRPIKIKGRNDLQLLAQKESE